MNEPLHTDHQDPGAADATASVYRELRRVALEQMQQGASLHSVYARAADESGVDPQYRHAVLLLCAQAMRRAVVAHMQAGADPRASRVLAIDEGLRAIERFNTRIVRVVECRYFAALSDAETAEALGTDAATVQRDWRRARAWLLEDMRSRPSSPGNPDVPVPNAAWADAVFGDALALPLDDRRRFLEESSAPARLRADVEELLRLAVEPGLEPGDLGPAFLWALLTDGVMPPAPAAAADSRAGAWRVIREIRPGETGSVYLAERPEGTTVAQGLVRYLGTTSASDVAERLVRRECRVLAALSHQGLARFLDVGRAGDGRLFIVTEHVEGRPIDQYSDEQSLTIDQRLELFVRACAAIQHAHRQLVVHGALESSTVVVTAGGDVKVLDAGIAALRVSAAIDAPDGPAAAGPIPAGQHAGPEPLPGEPLGAASDVYRLGRLLLELLTADTRTLPADLDAIVTRALRTEPERRYPSVSALRSDVQRFRMHLPVWAQPDTAAYRWRMFVVRRRAWLTAGVALLLAGVILVAVPVGRRFREARDASRITQVEQLLDGMLAVPGARAASQPPGAGQYLDQAAAMIRTDLAGQPQTQARLLTTVGRSYVALGYHDRAIDVLDEALAARRAQYGDDSLEVADTLLALGESEHGLGRYDEAESSLRMAVAIRQLHAGRQHPDTLDATIALGHLLHSKGDLAQAEPLLRETVTVLRPEMLAASDDAPVNVLLPRAMRHLGNVMRERGALSEAAALFKDAIDMLGQHAPGPNQEMAAARLDLSRLLVAQNALDAADVAMSDALAAIRRLHTADHPLLGTALREFGSLRLEQGRLDEAESFLAEAARVQDQQFGRLHPMTPRTRGLQAELARRRGRPAEAAVLAGKTLEEFERSGLRDHPCTIEVRATLAEALLATGAQAEAARVLDIALGAASTLLVADDPRVARLRELRARAGAPRP